MPVGCPCRSEWIPIPTQALSSGVGCLIVAVCLDVPLLFFVLHKLHCITLYYTHIFLFIPCFSSLFDTWSIENAVLVSILYQINRPSIVFFSFLLLSPCFRLIFDTISNRLKMILYYSVNVYCEYKTDTETFTDTFFQNQRLFYAVRKIKKCLTLWNIKHLWIFIFSPFWCRIYAAAYNSLLSVKVFSIS